MKRDIAAGLDDWETLIRNSRQSTAYIVRREQERAASSSAHALPVRGPSRPQGGNGGRPAA